MSPLSGGPVHRVVDAGRARRDAQRRHRHAERVRVDAVGGAEARAAAVRLPAALHARLDTRAAQIRESKRSVASYCTPGVTEC